MKLAIIVAATRDLAIGHNGDLLYHISADLRRFKAITMGHPIIMGRKTFESFPNGPLPGRRNIVITHNPSYTHEGIETASSLEEAIAMCADCEKAYIIGGGEIYRCALPMADSVELTLIDAEHPEAEVRFPYIELPETEFTEIDPRSGVRYAFLSIALK
ncbi:MAG: dihydrofolate reductase [Duncaniella sp.]|nr:dihydrofolate reductase [Duncaniella sp.]MDE6465739.1 dihydrofolate reductase [Duncaniella sp.]MDE6572993.1 dihydrofolate reductase [Duncaniella sp.]